MVLLGVAGVFTVIAVVFGVLAYFRVTPQVAGATQVSVPVTNTVTVSPSPGPTTVTVPGTPAVVTVTSTRTINVPQASAGSGLGAIESAASTLSTVVAAACAVIALRPHGRRGPPAAPAPADAPASTPST
jgi:hypothetical protein